MWDELDLDSPPDAVVLDASWPDGEVLLRRLAREHGLPILVVADGGGPEHMRAALVAGARDYLVRPWAGSELAQSVRAICRKVGTATGQVIALAGAKGGTGRTTLAAHLGVALTRSGGTVALADLDLEFGTLAVALGASPTGTIGDLARSAEQPDPATLWDLCQPVPGLGIRLLAAPTHPVQAAGAAPHVGEALDLLVRNADWVVVDLPRNLSEATLATMERAGHLLLVTTPDPLTLAATARLGRLLAGELGWVDKVRAVGNLTAPGPAARAARTIREAMGVGLAAMLPYDGGVPLALAQGRPLTVRRRSSPYADAVLALARDLQGNAPRPESAATRPEPQAKTVAGRRA